MVSEIKKLLRNKSKIFINLPVVSQQCLLDLWTKDRHLNYMEVQPKSINSNRDSIDQSKFFYKGHNNWCIEIQVTSWSITTVKDTGNIVCKAVFITSDPIMNINQHNMTNLWETFNSLHNSVYQKWPKETSATKLRWMPHSLKLKR